MARLLLAVLACVPVALWGAEEFLAADVPAAGPAPARPQGEPPRAAEVLATDALAVPLALRDQAPRGSGELADAARGHAAALALADEFAERYCRPLDSEGKVVAAPRACEVNEPLRRAWDRASSEAREAFVALELLQRTHPIGRLEEQLEFWLQDVVEQPELWKPFADEALEPGDKALAALRAYEGKYHRQRELITRARALERRWAAMHDAAGGINDALCRLDEEGMTAEVRLDLLAHLTAVVNGAAPELVDAADLRRAREAAQALCQKLLAEPFPPRSDAVRAYNAKVAAVKAEAWTAADLRRLRVTWISRAGELGPAWQRLDRVARLAERCPRLFGPADSDAP
jgi:hypothetical protein